MDTKQFFNLVPQALEQLPRGAFLTAKAPLWNPMTIGWAQFGVVWSRPTLMVLVRRSRYTYGLMEQAEAFTVSAPRSGELVKALAYCGSRSGRDVDKQKQTGLVPLAARAGGADGVAGCGAYFECRIVNKVFGDVGMLDEALRARYYGAEQALPDGDPHVLYFGEVLAAYEG